MPARRGTRWRRGGFVRTVSQQRAVVVFAVLILLFISQTASAAPVRSSALPGVMRWLTTHLRLPVLLGRIGVPIGEPAEPAQLASDSTSPTRSKSSTP